MAKKSSLAFLSSAALLFLQQQAHAFDITKSNNVVGYWGQNAGATEKNLAYYCGLGTYDVMILSFLNDFGVAASSLNFASHTGGDCVSNPSAYGCSTIAADIATCQSKGVAVLLSMGGAVGSYGFSSASQATATADSIWNLFMGGSSSSRPFGSAILDGVDLDLENGQPNYFSNFVTQLRSHYTSGSRKYYISSAPQCVYPDASVGDALNHAWFDIVNIQFYNNYCAPTASFNFATWVNWAAQTSINKNVKLMVGMPGSSASAGSGYASAAALQPYFNAIMNDASQSRYLGGLMVWTAETAYSNGNFAGTIKAYLSNGPGPNPNPSSSVGPTPTPSSSSANPNPNPNPNGYRCGSSWADANGRCGQACPDGVDSQCPSGEHCYNALDQSVCPTPGPTPTPSSSSVNPKPIPSSSSSSVNPKPIPSSSSSSSVNPKPIPSSSSLFSSSSVRPKPSSSSSASSSTAPVCTAVYPWSNLAGMNAWCVMNCITAKWCPAGYCKCNPQLLASARLTYQQTNQYPGQGDFVYSASCIRATASSGETLLQVANDYNSTSNSLLDAASYKAAFSCLNNVDLSTLGSTPAVSGQQYYIPGDCLLDETVNVNGRCSGGQIEPSPNGAASFVGNSVVMMVVPLLFSAVMALF